MQPSSSVLQSLQGDNTFNLLVQELVEIDDSLRQNPEYYQENMIRFYIKHDARPNVLDAGPALKAWLKLSSEDKEKTMEAHLLIVQYLVLAYKEFPLSSSLPASFLEFPMGSEYFIAPMEKTTNPLTTALRLGKMEAVKMFLKHKFSVNPSIFEFVVDTNNLELMKLLPKWPPTPKWTSGFRPWFLFLEYNFDRKRKPINTLTPEMLNIILEKDDHISLTHLLINAVYGNASRDVINTILPRMKPSGFLIRIYWPAFANIFQNQNEICVLVKKTFLAKLVQALRVVGNFSIFDISKVGLTQGDVRDYILNNARNLPLDQDGKTQLRREIQLLQDSNSGLHYFLRGYVLSRLRTGLIQDLEQELSKREATVENNNATPVQENAFTNNPFHLSFSPSSRVRNEYAENGLEMLSMKGDEENDNVSHLSPTS